MIEFLSQNKSTALTLREAESMWVWAKLSVRIFRQSARCLSMSMKLFPRVHLAAVAVLSLNVCAAEYNIVIYGGTCAAVTAAVQAKKMGKSWSSCRPTNIWADWQRRPRLYQYWQQGGHRRAVARLLPPYLFALRKQGGVEWQKKSEYGNKGQGTPAMDGENRTMWIFEPHVAEQVFEDFVREESSLSSATSGSTARKA